VILGVACLLECVASQAGEHVLEDYGVIGVRFCKGEGSPEAR
jgi:hypothetical protein